MILASVEQSATLESHHLFPEAIPSEGDGEEGLSFQESTKRFQKQLLLKTLEATQWNVSETARRLSLTRTHVQNLLAAFELRKLDPRKR